jgi:hypothetical protein
MHHCLTASRKSSVWPTAADPLLWLVLCTLYSVPRPPKGQFSPSPRRCSVMSFVFVFWLDRSAKPARPGQATNSQAFAQSKDDRTNLTTDTSRQPAAVETCTVHDCATVTVHGYAAWVDENTAQLIYSHQRVSCSPQSSYEFIDSSPLRPLIASSIHGCTRLISRRHLYFAWVAIDRQCQID